MFVHVVSLLLEIHGFLIGLKTGRVGRDLFVVDASERSNGSEGFPRRAGDMEVRFAAGCPLHTPEGRIAGHLCLVDDKPREFPESDQRMLSDFAGLVSDELVAAGQVFVDELTGIACAGRRR